MENSLDRTFAEVSGSFEQGVPFRESWGHRRVSGLTDNFAIIGVVLQQPAQFFSEIRNGISLSEKIWTLLTSSAIFLMIYGAVLGIGHPFLSLGAAMAVPLLFLGSLVTCIPVMYLFDVLTGSQRSLNQMIALLLAPVSTAATVFFSFAPIMIIFRLTGTLHQFFWLNIGIVAMATLVGLIYVTQGLIQTTMVDSSHNLSGVNRQLHFLWMLLFVIVMSQMAWSMLSYFQATGGFSRMVF